MRLPQSGQLQRRARCSVTSSSIGGKSKTCLTSQSSLPLRFCGSQVPQFGQAAVARKSWVMRWSGVGRCSKVEPGCPFWPPVFRFDFWRRLLGVGFWVWAWVGWWNFPCRSRGACCSFGCCVQVQRSAFPKPRPDPRARELNPRWPRGQPWPER